MATTSDRPASTVEPESRQAPAPGGQLKKSLKNRHLTMIALGGIIGAGLFVGSGAVINRTGPAAVLSYAASGVLMIFVMRAIGEMAVLRPAAGSVANFARHGLGDWAGFTIGWLYWYFWVVVAAIEAVAGAGILANYLPTVPTWALCLGLMLVMTAINLLSVKAYGESEFWLASVKIVAIIFFACVAVVFLLGGTGRPSPGLNHLFDAGGFFPLGIMAAVVGSVTVLFSMGGAEIATIAAAESEKPAEYAAKATKQVMYRVFTFYVLSVLLIVCVVPWDFSFSGKIIKSPFAVALDTAGIPYTGQMMQVVVLTAVLSSLNSCLYITSRMLLTLAEQREAPAFLAKVNQRGVPVRAILAGTSMGYLAVVANYFFPEEVFLFLINSSGAIQLIYYIVLVTAQIRQRKRVEREGSEPIKLKMWGFPYLSYVTIAWMAGVLIVMVVMPETRAQVGMSFLSLAVVLAAYAYRVRGRRRADAG
ncbi:amino acid permease [Streptomyces sp. SCSIO 75703]|uniref:amino acid permease n=1 Tax=unclassified Streptomyces TaxID=2593676 RepID=UPI00099D3BDC|nr:MULTISPECIES: amino acid permease [unclassified Streptomyces]